MTHKLGIMQGRFTSKNGFFPQQFPWEEWKNEFYIAKKYNIQFIEWMFNAEKYVMNPIWNREGRKEIRNISYSTGVKVSSICMNYYMENSILGDIKRAVRVLSKIAEIAQELGALTVVIPLFGESCINNDCQALYIMSKFASVASEYDIHLAFETNLDANLLKQCIVTVDNINVGICYDTGNMCGEGHDVISELESLRGFIKEIHIKDKKWMERYSVMLGDGAVPFKDIFRLMNNHPMYFILESYFGQDAVNDTVRNINYVRGNYER